MTENALPATIPRPPRDSASTRTAVAPAARYAVVAAFVAGYIGVGWLLQLPADAYLLLGIPLTVAFQRLVARRPLRALWVGDARPLRFSRKGVGLALALSVVPVVTVLMGVMAGSLTTALYGVVSIPGAFALVYALGASRRRDAKETLRTTVLAGAVALALLTLSAAASGVLSEPRDPVGTAVFLVVSLLQYLPAVFIVEEVLFRGALDPWVADGDGASRRSALFVAAVWGIWHVPLAGAVTLLTIAFTLAMHVPVGYALAMGRRRTGNLVAPGVAHSVIDAVRNALFAVA